MTGEDVDIGRKVAELGVKVSEIASLDKKIDKLTDLVNGVNLSLVGMKNDFMNKAECKLKCADCDKKFIAFEDKIRVVTAGQRQLFWSTVLATIAFVSFLLQKILNITLQVGGG